MPARPRRRSVWAQHNVRLGDLPTIEHWIRTLEDVFFCDARAVRDIRRLAMMYGMAGYTEAMLLIGKLSKKVCAGTSFINQSAFVTRSVNNAIGDIQRKGRGLLPV